MASTESPTDRSPLPTRRPRRIVAVSAGLVVSALVITGCTWLTGAAIDATPAQVGLSTGTRADDESVSTTLAATEAASEASTTDDGSEAKVASGEVLEVASRLTDASIEPGTCAAVAYTPDSASTVQYGDLCVPQEQTQSTAVVLVHGGGGTGGGRADLAAWQREYAALGYVTFSIDYRLVDPRTDTGVWPEPEQDVKAAIQFIRLAGARLGTDQVVVQGHSAGARLGGVILTTPDDAAFQGTELWAEASDAADGFIGFYGYYNGFQFEWDAYYGPGVEAPASSEVDTNAERASGPALLITGSADDLVDASDSDDLTAALTAAGKDATSIRVEGRNHGFDQQDGELTHDGHEMMTKIQSWLTEHIASVPVR